MKSKSTKIIPRIYLSDERVMAYLSDKGGREQIVKEISELSEKYDGVLIDSVFLPYLNLIRQYD